MNENKTNTSLLESPPDDRLPAGDSNHDIFSELENDEKSYKDKPKKFFADIQNLQNSGKYREAFGKLEIAKTLTDEAEFEKMAFITFKMAETLQQLAASGTEDDKTSLETLDEAESWLKISDQYKETMHKAKNDYEAAGKETYTKADDLYQMARDSDDDIEAVRLPLLNWAEDSLNKSDTLYAKARQTHTGEYLPIATKKRGFRLGAKAVMHSVKSSIKSALNHRN